MKKRLGRALPLQRQESKGEGFPKAIICHKAGRWGDITTSWMAKIELKIETKKNMITSKAARGFREVRREVDPPNVWDNKNWRKASMR